MASLLKHACPLLLVLPLTAWADGTTVTTHSTGTIYNVNSTALNALGLGGASESDPYELTVRSTFDPEVAAPGRGEWAFDYSSPIEIDLRIGEMRYHYAGINGSDVVLYTPYVTNEGDGYQHAASFTPLNAGYSIRLSHYGLWPSGSLGEGGALAPREAGAAAEGYFDITAYPLNPDAPGSWSFSGKASTFSVQVVSAVPEPASFAMLLAGLGGIALWRRARQFHAIKQGGTSNSKASTR